MHAKSESWQHDAGLLFFRAGLASSILYAHGLPKLTNVLNGVWDFPDPIGIGPEAGLLLSAFAETVCATLIIGGVWTRMSCIPLIVTMVVATWVINGGAPFIQQEKSFVYLLGWILLALTGPGRFTLPWLWQQAQGHWVRASPSG